MGERAMDEFAAVIRRFYEQLPEEVKTTLRRRGVSINAAEGDSTSPAGVFIPPQQAIVLYRAQLGAAPERSIEMVILHEIGHAMGMDHRRLRAFGL
jgi:predicted Zn-dependent protease with MMP-like domain